MAGYDITNPDQAPDPVFELFRDQAPYPDLPATEVVHPQGRVERAAGQTYATIEYVEVHQGLPMGPVGPTGPAGEDGGTLIPGSGDPNVALPDGPPNSNDLYLDTENGEIWVWDDSREEWASTGNNVLGPTGPPGPIGPLGPIGPTGPTGLQGGGLLIKGSFVNTPDCNTPPSAGVAPTPALGDAWIDSCYNLWGRIDVAGTPTWVNLGPMKGPTGPAGPGAERTDYPLAFVVMGNNVYAQMSVTIPAEFTFKFPTVNVLIDYKGTGEFVMNDGIYVERVSATTIRLTAEKSIIDYNGARGKVVLK